MNFNCSTKMFKYLGSSTESVGGKTSLKIVASILSLLEAISLYLVAKNEPSIFSVLLWE